MTEYLQAAQTNARLKASRIVPIPADCRINPALLENMTGDEFIAAFRALQETVLDCYADIEQDPSRWGFPEKHTTADPNSLAYNRLFCVLQGLAVSAALAEHILTVDRKAFAAEMKNHKKLPMLLEGLTRYGFDFEDYKGKAETFTAAFPSNPLVMDVLYHYIHAADPAIPYWHKIYDNFSHRWIEDPTVQDHEAVFLAEMDKAPPLLRELQYWLYDQAKRYGYTINLKKPLDKQCIHYTKGSKTFLHVGEREFFGKNYVFSKAIFRKVLETEPEKMERLERMAPHTFGPSPMSCSFCGGTRTVADPCVMRIVYKFRGKTCYNCAYNSFFSLDPSLETLKLTLELFLQENNIKA